MRRFAATLLRWRRTHYRIAVRMLGERTGTGYTEGAPYLKAVQTIPVFSSLANGEDAADAEARDVEGGDEIAPARTLDVDRCARTLPLRRLKSLPGATFNRRVIVGNELAGSRLHTASVRVR